jgi:hypothetical protein
MNWAAEGYRYRRRKRRWENLRHDIQWFGPPILRFVVWVLFYLAIVAAGSMIGIAVSRCWRII